MSGLSRAKMVLASAMVVWLALLLLWQWKVQACAAGDGIFDLRSWSCRPVMPPIILERGIQRS